MQRDRPDCLRVDGVLMEDIVSLQIAIAQQGQKLVELENRLRTFERALRAHVNDLETAHKL